MDRTRFPDRKLLRLTFALVVFAVSLAGAQIGSCREAAQSPVPSEAYVPTMAFDVASVRESPDADSYMVSGSFAPHSSSLHLTNFDAGNLLSMAYGIRRDLIVGIPDPRTMFNIQAKSDTLADARLASLNKEQEVSEQRHMLQALLADRFKLKVHWETRQGPTYNLIVAKNGPRIREGNGKPPTPEENRLWNGQPLPHIYQRGDSQTGFAFVAHGCSMEDLAGMLAGQFAANISGKTGLSGRYDFTVRYLGTRQSERRADDTDPVPSLEEALSDQLGLKLEHAKGLVQYLVVDHMQKPSAN